VPSWPRPSPDCSPARFGFLADWFGRRSIFTWALLAYSAASVIMAFQTSAGWVRVWRFIAGIGIEVEIITVDAYITELVVVMFMVFNLCQAFGFYGFANWVPTLLIEQGITITTSLQYALIVVFAYPIAPLLAASFADKFERNGSSAAPASRSSCSASRSRSSPRPCC
jgi:MFS family permease